MRAQSVRPDGSGPAASGGVSVGTAAGATGGRDAAAAPTAGSETGVRKVSLQTRPAESWSREPLTCSFLLSACDPGLFGADCGERCQCVHGASCDHVTGECQCLAGWRGKLCDKGTIAAPGGQIAFQLFGYE